MNIIKHVNPEIVNALNENNNCKSTNYRLMKYLITVDYPKFRGKIIFNSLTRALVFIPNFQFANIYKDHTKYDYIDYLVRNYFLVPEDFDEMAETDRLRLKFRPVIEEGKYLANGMINEFTIFVTTRCNARCFYCYEKDKPKYPMTLETAEKVGNYIVKVCSKNGYPIRLRWFGGEPLFNEKVIDRICEIVKESGLNYESSFISNGYLFKEEKLQKYDELWHLRSGQITLDGTEEVYNKAKNFIYKDTNAFQVVTNNIKMLADHGLWIAIRMNMDMYNADDIKELIKYMHGFVGNHDKIGLYCYPLFDYDEKRDDEQRRAIYNKLYEIEQVLDEYGYYHGRGFDNGIRATHCMVDHGRAVCISPDGRLGLCEHYFDEELFGTIDDPKDIDWDMVRSWQEYEDPLDICKDCPMYPSCIRNKKCQDLNTCNAEVQAWRLREDVRSAKDMFEKWVKDNNYKADNINRELVAPTCECKKQSKFKSFIDKILIFLKLK